MSAAPDPAVARLARSLFAASAIRARANRIYDLGLNGALPHFTIDTTRIDGTADYVVRVIRSNFPTLQVPPHSRWRHFEVGEVDRWGMLAGARDWTDPMELGRAAFDLAFVSTLIDANAGSRWSYAESVTGETFSRSEGLAIASLVMFAGGAFSSEPFDPLRADAGALARLTREELADAFQVSTGNPLPGLDTRLDLINRLGRAMEARPDLFATGNGIRPGGLLDHLLRRFPDGSIPAPEIQDTLMEALGSVFPSTFTIGGIPLGDTWAHSLLARSDDPEGLVPLHKPTLWLAYSLIEPIVWAGHDVRDLDGLPSLADYRNGGLLIDNGILRPRDPNVLRQVHTVGSEVIVEWRALTVALIDRLAAAIRQRLARNAMNFPLACIIEGGTWAAGRRLARERRADGSPPLMVESDGVIF
ncbi:DUF1688 family protein [Methyloraptor flagellatus]|uniref:DUF1688 family protein n=1 Tax=Methyloraptor flagellatus TaxID=3162530 RepID=A0AAU7X5Z6_9HYPH